ncbi:PQQ-dependent sugar dehydrogenase [Achromobacter sp. KS-M25]|nr:PQQ-dependent sugar dehydrogenase [Achromobacter aestuarii]
MAEGLDRPWALAFLPDGAALITERSGAMRLWQEGKGAGKPISGVPKVWSSGQGGLLDVVLAPDFATSRWVYFSYAEAGDGKAGTAVARGKLNAERTALTDVAVIFRQMPKLSVGNHFGSRLAFDRDGYLFITLGENNQRPTAQDLDKLQGKVVRLRADGKVPPDNPFVNKAGARPEIWTYGMRNPQGMAIHPVTGAVWENEHGPRGGDEINILSPGKNYGWPIATHGINYSGQPIPEAKGKSAAGMEDPHFVWEKSPGLSGMAFYTADRFPQWKNSIFIGALATQELIRVKLDGNKVVGEERLLADRGERVRDVRVGPDGYVYALTDESNGKLLKIGLKP